MGRDSARQNNAARDAARSSPHRARGRPLSRRTHKHHSPHQHLMRCTWHARDSTIFPIQTPRLGWGLKDGRAMSVITDRWRRGCRRRMCAVVVVDEFFQFFAGFEIRNSLGGDAHGIARLRISTAPRPTLSHAKTANAAHLNLLALIQGLNDAFKNDFDQTLSVFLGELSRSSYVFDEFRFSHALPRVFEI